MLTVAFGDSTVNRTQVQLCDNRFKEGRQDVNDNARPGGPSMSRTYENIEAVKKVIVESLLERLLMMLAYHSAHAKQFLRMVYTRNVQQRRLFQNCQNFEQPQRHT